MARSSATDLLDTFRFQIQIDGFIRAGFTECSAPSVEIKVKEYIEAGRHMNPLKITESATFPDIILNRGVSTDTDFMNWVQQVYSVNNSGGGPNSASLSYRRTVQIFQYNRAGQLIKTYILYNCIPTQYKSGTDFNAMEDAISMESLRISYEGFAVALTNSGGIVNQILSIPGGITSQFS